MADTAKVVDLFDTVATMRANAATDQADACAAALYPIVDRFRIAAPCGDTADVIGAEATALLAANVALVAGLGVGRRQDLAAAQDRMHFVLDHIVAAINAHRPAIAQQLADLDKAGDL